MARTDKGRPVRVVLRASVGKAVWRELHALTVKAVSESAPGGPAALQNVTDETAFDLGVGALVANKAKLVDVTEVFPTRVGMVPDEMFSLRARVSRRGVMAVDLCDERLLREEV